MITFTANGKGAHKHGLTKSTVVIEYFTYYSVISQKNWGVGTSFIDIGLQTLSETPLSIATVSQ